MNNKKIGVGDLINVHFETIPCLWKVRVLSTPFDVGDCWKLYDEKADKAYNVQLFGMMERVEEVSDE